MKNRHGGTSPADFLQLAIDGMQARIDGMQEQLEALRASAASIQAGTDLPTPEQAPQRPEPRTLAIPGTARNHPNDIPPGYGVDSLGRRYPIRRKEYTLSADTKPNPTVELDKAGHPKAQWTPAMRKAQAKRMKQRWKAGAFDKYKATNQGLKPKRGRPPRIQPVPTTGLTPTGRKPMSAEARANISRARQEAFARRRTEAAEAQQ